MATKIYISPSDQDENLYSYSKDGHTYNEMEVNEEIAKYLEIALNRCGSFEVKRNDTHAISKAIAASNAFDADYHICLHTNACGTPSVIGCRIYYWTGNQDGYELAQRVYNKLNAITPGESSFVQANNTWNEQINVNATTCYCESVFHSSPIEAKWVVENTKEVAEAICEGICQHCGVEYVKEKETEKEQAWRVQVGYYKVRSNAERMRDKLKADGYSAFIVEVK